MIALTSELFRHFLPENGSCVMDAYIGYYTQWNFRVTPFDAAGHTMPPSDEDAMRSNEKNDFS